jgi:hypothetical protein
MQLGYVCDGLSACMCLCVALCWIRVHTLYISHALGALMSEI